VSYIVLARKWRPKRFKDVVGQEHITTTLINSINSAQLAHAYLFVGPRGIGKTSTARILSKALNCPEADGGEPCGECGACREIAEGRSVDVLEIDGASNNSVEDVRTLRENVRIAPAYLRYKVYIIDEVHMLSSAAFNAFLKTLEEPPDHVKFILATTEAQKIPATVLSRCQRFDFRRLTSRQIFKRLKEIVEAEGIRAEEGALFTVARAAEGSMRDAQSILDQLVSFSADEITVSDTHAMLGTVGSEVYRQIAVAISEGDSPVIFKTLDEIIERGKDLAQFLKELTLYFRNLLIAGMESGHELIDLPEEDLSALKDVSAKFRSADLIRMVRDLSELESQFRQLPSPRVAVEMHLMKMSELGAEVSIDSILSKLTALEKRLKDSGTGQPPAVGGARQMVMGEGGSGVAEASSDTYVHASDEPPDEMPDEPEPPDSSSQEEDDQQLNLWRQFLDEVREQSMSIYSFLEKGRFCGVQSGQMMISFADGNSYNKTYLERKEVRMLLEEILKTIAGNPIRLKLIVEREDSETPAISATPVQKKEKPTGAEEARQQSVEKALNNPIVKKTVELFKGKIVYVSG